MSALQSRVKRKQAEKKMLEDKQLLVDSLLEEQQQNSSGEKSAYSPKATSEGAANRYVRG